MNMRLPEDGTKYLEDNGFKHFAFISYRHQDAKTAEWLKEQLASYSLPASIVADYNLPAKTISPVFLDEDDMRPGNLDDETKLQISLSKFLIVICSKNTNVNSRWVDQEIQYFMETRQCSGHIIPLIIDESEKPEDELYPPALRNLRENGDNICGPSFFDSQKGTKQARRHKAFLKILAKMHGVQVSEIERQDKIIQRKKVFRVGTFCFAMLALIVALLFGTKYYFNHIYVYKEYYLDYTTSYGEPVGIGKLLQKEISGKSGIYLLKKKDGHVIELQYINSYGTLIEHEKPEETERPVKASYNYTDGKLKSVKYYSVANEEIVEFTYSDNLKVVDLNNNGEFSSSFSVVSDPTNVTTSLYDFTLDEDKSQINRYLLEYDNNGYIIEKRYSSDKFNSAAKDASGISGVTYERDNLGRATKVSYIAIDGENSDATNADEYYDWTTSVGIAYRTLTYVGYNLTSVKLFDEQGRSVSNDNDWAVINLEYENDNLVREQYISPEGNALTQYTYMYNQDGLKTRVTVEKFADASSYYYEYAYDNLGRITKCSFYDKNGQPTYTKRGYYAWMREFDDNGHIIRATYLDELGNPTAIDDGTSGYSVEYDKLGNMISYSFLDVNGHLILNNKNYARVEYEYNSNHQVTQGKYYDIDGSTAIFCKDNYAGWKTTYDKYGNVIKVQYCDLNEKPIEIAQGYSSFTREYDSSGHLVCEHLLDCNGLSVECDEGYSEIRRQYDSKGHMVMKSYFDSSGNLVSRSDGYAGYVVIYDKYCNECARTWFKDDGIVIILQVRKAGDNKFNTSMEAAVGDVLEWQIIYKNTSETTARDVMVKVSLPTNLTYSQQSTCLYNSNHPNGVMLVDRDNSIITGGINIGGYTYRSNAYIRFTTTVSNVDLFPGRNELRNWVTVTVWDHGDNGEILESNHTEHMYASVFVDLINDIQ